MNHTHHLGWLRPRLTKLECFVVVIIIVTLVALLLPAIQWAASGSIRIPVRVFVFDVEHARPIPKAHVAISRGPFADAELDIENLRDRVPIADFDRLNADSRGLTGEDGTAVVNHEFRTGSSHHNPTPRAHLMLAWIVVAAEGYGTVVIPVNHDSMPTETLRERKELFVPIGLIRDESHKPGNAD